MSKDICWQAIDEALQARPAKIPAETGIKAGGKFWLDVKVGGEMQAVTVVCKGRPYKKTLGNGGTALYADVFGYGVRRAVNIKKLRCKN